jgi:hypothetical protein
MFLASFPLTQIARTLLTMCSLFAPASILVQSCCCVLRLFFVPHALLYAGKRTFHDAEYRQWIQDVMVHTEPGTAALRQHQRNNGKRAVRIPLPCRLRQVYQQFFSRGVRGTAGTLEDVCVAIIT